jgi:hypothetical protein
MTGTATERIYVTADGRFVPDGHHDAAFLAAGVGAPLPEGFTGFDTKAESAPPNKAEKKPPNKSA